MVQEGQHMEEENTHILELELFSCYADLAYFDSRDG